jgi:putative heme iron utilization protein
MFKVFGGRNEKRKLLTGRRAGFERLRDAQTSAA